MKKRLYRSLQCISIICCILFPFHGNAQNGTRNEINIPDIRGYVTLKCDFHMHTVFSDGNVWPVTRVEEAWLEGLDAISITDHIEYQPHKADIPTKHNRPYEIAKPSADALGMILIRGTEITRDTPPGHHNALFLTEIDSLDTPDFYDAIGKAVDQGGFVFYNHPGWKHPEKTAEWFVFQQMIYDNGWLHGVEVVNGYDYYPLAHQWCIEKNLTMFGNSDIHPPITFRYDFSRGEHRPVTLVFAKRRSEEAIRDALVDRRTAVWWKNYLIGDEEYLRPIFDESVEIVNPEVTITGNGSAVFRIHNDSDIDYELLMDKEVDLITVPKNLTLYAGKTVRFTIRKKSQTVPEGQKPKEITGRKKIRIPMTVTNLYAGPNTGLDDELTVTVMFESAQAKR